MLGPNFSPVFAWLIIGSTAMAMLFQQPGVVLSQNLKVDASPEKHNDHHRGRHHPPSPEPPAPTDSPDDGRADPVRKYLASIPKKLKHFADDCTKHITPTCGEEIVSALFNPRNKVHADCCHQLVGIGIKCHDAIVTVFSGMPDVRQAAPLLKAHSHGVFNYCVNIDKKNIKPPPSSQNLKPGPPIPKS